MLDLLCSITGIFIVHAHELLYGKNYLHSKTSDRTHNLYWYILVIFRKNFKLFVRSMGMNPWKYPRVEDLKSCRLMTKEDLYHYFPEKNMGFLFRILSLKMSSSGSTGSPFMYRIFFLQWIQEQARVYASFRLGGYSLGKKMVVFRSYSPVTGQKDIKEVVWKNWTYFNSFNLSDDKLFEYFNYLKNNQVKYLRTYPSTLKVFLEFLKTHNLLLNLKMVHVSSENISSTLIRDAEKFFNCRVINYYGQVEQAVLGVNLHHCDSIALLPYSNVYLLEDGTLAASNLLNWTNPLINYHVTDRLTENSKGGFRVLGRNSVRFRHIDGYEVSTINIFTLMQTFTGLVNWQISQSLSKAIVKIHFKGDLTESDMKVIRDGLEVRIGKWQYEFVDGEFIYSGEGKINPIISVR